MASIVEGSSHRCWYAQHQSVVRFLHALRLVEMTHHWKRVQHCVMASIVEGSSHRCWYAQYQSVGRFLHALRLVEMTQFLNLMTLF